MKINWKIRAKSKTFWVSLVAATLTFVYALLGLFGVVAPVSQEQIMNLALCVLSILVSLGIVVDPTTKGINDSERAMGYDEPGGGTAA